MVDAHSAATSRISSTPRTGRFMDDSMAYPKTWRDTTFDEPYKSRCVLQRGCGGVSEFRSSSLRSSSSFICLSSIGNQPVPIPWIEPAMQLPMLSLLVIALKTCISRTTGSPDLEHAPDFEYPPFAVVSWWW